MSQSSDGQFVLFSEFSEFEESEWNTLIKEGRFSEQEEKACERRWTGTFSQPPEESSWQLKNVVEVQFKGTRRGFYENKENLDVAKGDAVFVEAEKGIDLGIVHLTGELVRVKRRTKGILYREEKKLLRKASAVEGVSLICSA